MTEVLQGYLWGSDDYRNLNVGKMMQYFSRKKKRLTNGPTDEPTDGLIDIPSFRVAFPRPKREKRY